MSCYSSSPASIIAVPVFLSLCPALTLASNYGTGTSTGTGSDWNNQSNYWLEDMEYDDSANLRQQDNAPPDSSGLSLATLILIAIGAVFFCTFCGAPLALTLFKQFMLAWNNRRLQKDPLDWEFDDLPEDPEDKKGVKTVCQEHKEEVCHDCACDYTVLNQLCYHYQYIMTEELYDDRAALTKCFMAVHFRNIPPQEKALSALSVASPMAAAKKVLRKKDPIETVPQCAEIFYALRSHDPPLTKKDDIHQVYIDLADKSVKHLQKARMMREIKAASDRRKKALEQAEQRMLDALDGVIGENQHSHSHDEKFI